MSPQESSKHADSTGNTEPSDWGNWATQWPYTIATTETIMTSTAFLTFSVLNYPFTLLSRCLQGNVSNIYSYVIIMSRMVKCNYRYCCQRLEAARLIGIMSTMKAVASAATAGSFTGKPHLFKTPQKVFKVSCWIFQYIVIVTLK